MAVVQRDLLTFSVRTMATRSIAEVSDEVRTAFGCHLQEGVVDRVPGMTGHVLGMLVTIQPWTGRGDAHLYRLRGDVLDPRFIEKSGAIPTFVTTDISAYVLDLLTVTTDEAWYIADEDDLRAELEFGRRLDEAYDN